VRSLLEANSAKEVKSLIYSMVEGVYSKPNALEGLTRRDLADINQIEKGWGWGRGRY
jgi:hypothetical protein